MLWTRKRRTAAAPRGPAAPALRHPQACLAPRRQAGGPWRSHPGELGLPPSPAGSLDRVPRDPLVVATRGTELDSPTLELLLVGLLPASGVARQQTVGRQPFEDPGRLQHRPAHQPRGVQRAGRRVEAGVGVAGFQAQTAAWSEGVVGAGGEPVDEFVLERDPKSGAGAGGARDCL